jgi:short-subunit dehydrogenase
MSSPGVCVVVGVGPGLGSAAARRFAAGGYDLGLINRSQEVIQALAAELSSAVRTVAVVADAAQDSSLAAAIDEVAGRLGPISVLVYNAVSYAPGPPAELVPAELLRDLRINVVGALIGVQAVASPMRERGHGVIILTGGGAALYPSPDYASLAITKSALRTLALVTHAELLPAGVFATTVTIAGSIGGSPRFAPECIADTFWDIAHAKAEHRRPEYVYAENPAPLDTLE